MSALHRRAPYWTTEESVAPSTPGRSWLISSGTMNLTDLSQTLSNLCTQYRVVTNPLRSLPLLLKVLDSALWVGHSLCSSAADGIMGGTAEDHATTLDNWKLSMNTLRPTVRLSVTPNQMGISSNSTVTMCLCCECFCRQELPWFFVQFHAPTELANAD
jgi:hypothetical protein